MRVRLQQIPEHYHVGWETKDGMHEVSVGKVNDYWVVEDDWGDIIENGTIDAALFKSENLKEALFSALDCLHAKFKEGYPIRGAGAPPDKIIDEWVKRKNG